MVNEGALLAVRGSADAVTTPSDAVAKAQEAKRATRRRGFGSFLKQTMRFVWIRRSEGDHAGGISHVYTGRRVIWALPPAPSPRPPSVRAFFAFGGAESRANTMTSSLECSPSRNSPRGRSLERVQAVAVVREHVPRDEASPMLQVHRRRLLASLPEVDLDDADAGLLDPRDVDRRRVFVRGDVDEDAVTTATSTPRAASPSTGRASRAPACCRAGELLHAISSGRA